MMDINKLRSLALPIVPLRWIADADGCADDLEHLCYVNGLPFSYFDKEVS